jgi:hypothetical protein
MGWMARIVGCVRWVALSRDLCEAEGIRTPNHRIDNPGL